MDRTIDVDDPRVGDQVRVPGGTVGVVVTLADSQGNPTDRPTHARVRFAGHASWIPIGSVRVVGRLALPPPEGNDPGGPSSPDAQHQVDMALLSVDGLLGTKRLVEASVVRTLEESFGHIAKVIVPTDHPSRETMITSIAYSGDDFALAELAVACHHARRLVVTLEIARSALERRRSELSGPTEER